MTVIKAAELYTTRNGENSEVEGLSIDVGINSLLELGVDRIEMSEAIKELGW